MISKKMRLMAAVLVLLLLALAGCSSPPTEEPQEAGEVVADEPNVVEEAVADEKLMVAVTIVPLGTFAQAVGGDLVDVHVVVPPGNSPGNYEPTPQEMENFSNASLYFAMGAPTEAANIMPRAEEIETMDIIRLQDEVHAVHPDRELAPGRRDAHIWLSPKRAMVMVEAMAREMGRVDPANQGVYAENAQSFMEELEALDADLTETFSGLENRKFIVFHPAFGYLADDYGMEMYALEQDGKEATPQRMQEMVDLAKSENIKVIFYQKEIDSKQSQAFAEEIGGTTVQLAPLSPDYLNNLRKVADTMAEVL